MTVKGHQTKRQIHSLLENKVTFREYKVGENGGKGFGCPSKKEEECMLLPYSAQVLNETALSKDTQTHM